METFVIKESTLTEVADQIRIITGKTEKIPVTELANEVVAVQKAGYDEGYGDASATVYPKAFEAGQNDVLDRREELRVVMNGTYEPEDGCTGFKKVVSEIPTLELNVVYDEEKPPLDKTKLWIKTSKPNQVTLGRENFEYDEFVAEQLQKLNFYRNGAGTVVIGDVVYLVGGNIYDESANTTYSTDTIEFFNMKTKEVGVLDGRLPRANEDFACAAVGSKIYTFGGVPSYTSRISNIYCYDVETQTSTTLGNLQRPNCVQACAAIGKYIYIAGGPYDGLMMNDDSIYRFDTETLELINYASNSNVAYQGAAMTAIGTKLFLVGGRGQQISSASYYPKTVTSFDVETKVFTVLPGQLNTDALYCSIATVENKIYVFGGNSYDFGRLNTIYCINTLTGEVELIPTKLPTVLQGQSSASFGKEIFILGGYNNITPSYKSNSIYRMVGGHILPENHLEVTTQYEDNFFNIINNDIVQIETGLKKVYKGNEFNHSEDVEAYIYKEEEWTQI